MNIKECIDTVDNLKPNQYTIREKVMWLSFIEEIIINDVLKTHEGYDGRYDDFEGYSDEKISVTLIVPSPYDRLYTAYLTMKIDEANNETARYNNSATLYNTYMMEYKKYYNKTHMPLDVLGRKHNMKPIPKPSAGLSDAELQNIINELTYNLTEYFSNTISPDKVYDIVTEYVHNNIEMLKGKDGKDGADGKDGYTPRKNIDYFDGEKGDQGERGLQGPKGDNGEKGDQGADGKDGYTPQVGIDYFTNSDKSYIINQLKEYIVNFVIPDESITSDKLSDEALKRIDDNKFDGVIRYGYDNLDKLPTPENRVLIYKIDDMSTVGYFNGILIVSGLWGTATDLSGKDVPVVVRVDQTRISTRGEVYSRYALEDYGELIWSEWEFVGGAGINLENGKAQNSIQQPPETYSWGATNTRITEFLEKVGYKNSKGSAVLRDPVTGQFIVGAFGANSAMFGAKGQTLGGKSHAEGSKTLALENNSHAEGNGTFAGGEHSHAEGNETLATGTAAHAEGNATSATNTSAHAEGTATEATGEHSHAEGWKTYSKGEAAHAEGYGCTAEGFYSHAEGSHTEATHESSHAEGNRTHATGWGSHSEGSGTYASGKFSHAEGEDTQATRTGSHAEGLGTIAADRYQHVQGQFNEIDTEGKYLDIVGNGNDNEHRSNAYTLDKKGNAYFAGSVDVNAVIFRSSTSGSTKRFKLTIDDSKSLKVVEVNANGDDVADVPDIDFE